MADMNKKAIRVLSNTQYLSRYGLPVPIGTVKQRCKQVCPTNIWEFTRSRVVLEKPRLIQHEQVH